MKRERGIHIDYYPLTPVDLDIGLFVTESYLWLSAYYKKSAKSNNLTFFRGVIPVVLLE